jgi:predicted 3-demethylubiquinone-9 3-methyltransferase (glyoxalase superfamily)
MRPPCMVPISPTFAALAFLPDDIRPGPSGSINTIRFLLNGQELAAVNGGGYFGKFFAVDAQEVQPCGWVKDRFGVSWQIVPSSLTAMTEDPDRRKAQRVMTALYGMTRVDAEALRRAYEEPVTHAASPTG